MHYHKKEFFRKVDAPLSALACNCLQLTCLFPTRSTFCVYRDNTNCTFDAQDDRNNQNKAITATWMHRLVKANPTITLREMVIPGTHDSAAGSIGSRKIFSAAGITQTCDIRQQLEQGARYLDVRLAPSKGKKGLSIWHGCLEGGNFRDVLEDVADFAQEFPSEVILLELVPEYGKTFPKEAKQQALDMTLEVLGSEIIIPASDLKACIETKPLSQVSGQTQHIAVMLHERFWEDLDDVPNCFANSKRSLINPWHNTRSIPELLEKNLEAVRKFRNNRGRLVSHQFFGTPGVSNAADVWGALVGSNSLRPVSFAIRLYDILDDFFRGHADEPWNIVTLDFMDLCPELVEFCVALNWRDQLAVELGVVHTDDGQDVNVTERLQSLVVRDAVLLLVEPDRDLQVTKDEHFKLTIAYSVKGPNGAGKQFYVASVGVDCDCPVLLSPFSHNMECVERISNDAHVGVVHGGKVYTTVADIPNQASASTVEFSMDGENCSFSVV